MYTKICFKKYTGFTKKYFQVDKVKLRVYNSAYKQWMTLIVFGYQFFLCPCGEGYQIISRNKYFWKFHMVKRSKSIEDKTSNLPGGCHLSGAVCQMCNETLCANVWVSCVQGFARVTGEWYQSIRRFCIGWLRSQGAGLGGRQNS